MHKISFTWVGQMTGLPWHETKEFKSKKQLDAHMKYRMNINKLRDVWGVPEEWE